MQYNIVSSFLIRKLEVFIKKHLRHPMLVYACLWNERFKSKTWWSYCTCNKHVESWPVQCWAVSHVSICSAGTWSYTLLTQSTRWCCGVWTPAQLWLGSSPCSLLPITSWTRWCLSSVKQPGTASGRVTRYATSDGWQRRFVLATSVCTEMFAMWRRIVFYS